MEIILDCETEDTTLASVSCVYEQSPTAISDFLISLPLDEHYCSNNLVEVEPYNLTFMRLFKEEFGNPIIHPNAAYWFHLTRVLPSENFSSGILPRNRILDKLWDTLFIIFSGTKYANRIKELQRDILKDSDYRLKVTDSSDWGPFAMLVKEVAFKSSEIGNHDYLELPEFFELICVIYEEEYGESIRGLIVKALKPCIVKFVSRKGNILRYVDIAAYYLYCKLNNLELSLDTNTCFDGECANIHPQDIIKIEFINRL